MARGLNGSANGSSQWHGNEKGVEARRPGGESNLPPEVVDVLPAVVGRLARSERQVWPKSSDTKR